MTNIHQLQREAVTALTAALAADIRLAYEIDHPTHAALALAQDTTYTYFAALTRFKFALRDLMGTPGAVEPPALTERPQQACTGGEYVYDYAPPQRACTGEHVYDYARIWRRGKEGDRDGTIWTCVCGRKRLFDSRDAVFETLDGVRLDP